MRRTDVAEKDGRTIFNKTSVSSAFGSGTDGFFSSR
jgi:hypothetical protein